MDNGYEAVTSDMDQEPSIPPCFYYLPDQVFFSITYINIHSHHRPIQMVFIREKYLSKI